MGGGGEFIIILLLAVGLFVLQYIFRGVEENKQQQKPRGPNAPRTNPQRSRRQTNDMDRFLEETRKRQQEENKPAESPTLDRAEQVERERRGQTGKPKPQPRPAPRPPDRRPPPRRGPGPPVRREAPPVLLEVVPDTPPTRSIPAPTPTVVQRTPPPPPAPPPVPTVQPARLGTTEPVLTAAGPRRGGSPLLAELVKMLRRPQGLASAVVLQEILGPPVSRRSR